MIYTFDLPMPPSINETYRTHGRVTYKTDKARDWEVEAGWRMKNVKTQPNDEHEYDITLQFFFKRDRDIDSGIKILLDFLQGKFYVNDRQVIRLFIEKSRDAENPRVEVAIQEISTNTDGQSW